MATMMYPEEISRDEMYAAYRQIRRIARTHSAEAQVSADSRERYTKAKENLSAESWEAFCLWMEVDSDHTAADYWAEVKSEPAKEETPKEEPPKDEVKAEVPKEETPAEKSEGETEKPAEEIQPAPEKPKARRIKKDEVKA